MAVIFTRPEYVKTCHQTLQFQTHFYKSYSVYDFNHTYSTPTHDPLNGHNNTHILMPSVPDL